MTTEKSKYRQSIEKKLQSEKIDYLIRDNEKSDTINVFFGKKPCVDVVKTFSPKLNELTPEQDFILGILLGYDKVEQCNRFFDYSRTFKKRFSQ